MAVTAMIGELETLTPQQITYRYYVRVQVPVALRPSYANAGAVSVWPNAGETVLAALRVGALVERTGLVTIPNEDTVTAKRDAVRAAVQAHFLSLKAEIAALVSAPAVGDTYDDEAQVWTERRTARAAAGAR